jgi:hypothetical protein
MITEIATLPAAALAYIPRTVPLEPRGKKPTPKDWPNWVASTEAVGTWWRNRPASNVGIRTGNGLIVLDVDPRTGADDDLADLLHRHGELPPTVTCDTGGGGQHYYFAGPTDVPSFDISPGLEIKAAGRQVVAPPSVHPDTGEAYRWRPGYGPGEVERAQIPAWLIGGRQTPPDGRHRAKSSEAWVNEVAAGVTEGGRNTAMASLVGHLLRRYVDPHLTASIAHLVNRASYRPPLPIDEVDAILDSIAGRELVRRNSEGEQS